MSGLFQSVLEWIYSWVGNYGWSVVVFTLLVRFVLLPLDIRSKKSMRAMNRIQPQIQVLQKKYANDKEKMNRKLTELYRKEHVSPTAGCLPLLISLPVLWWMFAAMRNMANEHTINMILNMKQMLADGQTAEAVAESVRGSMQSWLWIKNVFQPDSFTASILPRVGDPLRAIMTVKNSAVLTQENLEAARAFLATDQYASVAALFGTDNFMHLQLNLLFFRPILSLPKSFANLFDSANGLFILPLLAGASQLIMTKTMNGTQPKQDGADMTQEQQAASNAMNSGFMKWFFPLFSLYICAGYNAAFAIYWMAANVIQIAQQLAVNWYFAREDKKALEETKPEE